MTNPIRGVLLEGKYYDYIADSFRESVPLSNSSDVTQSSKTFGVLGSRPKNFTITLDLANTYNVKFGTSWGAGVVGTTTWLGVSRRVDLENFVGALGTSLPLTFVTPYGVTYSVVPIGQIDHQIFIPENPEVAGVEFRSSLSFEATS